MLLQRKISKHIYTYEMGIKPFYVASPQVGNMTYLYTNHYFRTKFHRINDTTY